MKKNLIVVLFLICSIFTFQIFSKNNLNQKVIMKSSVHCFSPKGKCGKWLVSNWYKTRRTLDIAIYSFTDKSLLRALINLRKRGVKIRVLLSKGAITRHYSLAKKLISMNFNSRVWMLKGKMHNKFSIIDNQKLITGSFNYSKSAKKRNAENMIVSERSDVIHYYSKYFESLWESSCKSGKVKINYRKKVICIH